MHNSKYSFLFPLLSPFSFFFLFFFFTLPWLFFSFFFIHQHSSGSLSTLMCRVLVWLVSSLLSPLFVDSFETFPLVLSVVHKLRGLSGLTRWQTYSRSLSIGLNCNMLCTSNCIFSSFHTMRITVSLRGNVSYSVLLLLYFTQINDLHLWFT